MELGPESVLDDVDGNNRCMGEPRGRKGKSMMGCLRHTTESPLWAYGPFAELCFFLLEKEGDKRKPAFPPEWPSLRYDCRQFYGFNDGNSESGQLPGSHCIRELGRWT